MDLDQTKEFVAESEAQAVEKARSHFGLPPENMEVRVLPSSLKIAGLGARVIVLAAPRGEEAPAAEPGPIGAFVREVVTRMKLARELRMTEGRGEQGILIRIRSDLLDERSRQHSGVAAALAHLATRFAQETLGEEEGLEVRVEITGARGASRPERSDRDRDRGRDRDARGRGRDRGDRDRGRGGERDRGRGRDRGRDRPDGGREPRSERGGDDGAQGALERMAREKAEEVARTGEPQVLPPMGSRDRWVVHNAIKEITGVTSLSIGEGLDKRVKIEPE